MNDLFVLAQLLHEFLDAVLVEERLLLRRFAALVGQRDLEAGIEEGQFAQTRLASRSNLNSVVIVKIVGSGRNVMSVPVCFLFFTSPMTSSFCVVLPRSKPMW